MMTRVRPLGQDFSCIPDPERAEYLRLVKLGDLQSVVLAGAIFPGARADAAKIREVLNWLALKPKVERATRDVTALDAQLARLEDRLAALLAERNQLRQQRDIVAEGGDLAAWQRAAEHRACGALVRIVLEKELRAAGIL